MHWGSFWLGVVAAFGLSTLTVGLLSWRAATPGPVLRLLGRAETPQEDVRHVLMLLDELERQFRAIGLILPEPYTVYELLAAARGRAWTAVTKLEGGTP